MPSMHPTIHPSFEADARQPSSAIQLAAQDLCFDQVQYNAVRTSDVHSQADSIRNWAQQYDQISRGRFNGHLREVWVDTPRVQVFHEYTERLTFQCCLPWSKSVWFGIPCAHEHKGLGFCGHDMVASEAVLMTARHGEAFNLRTPEHFGIYGVLVDESEWLARLERWGVETSSLPSVQNIRLAPQVHRDLCVTIEAILSLGEAGEADQPWGRATLASLLDHVLQLLYTIPASDHLKERQRLSRDRLQVVMRARELVRQSPGADYADDLRMEQLCDRLHITRRTFQNYCMSVVGESPSEFLKSVRLNACRRALQTPHQPPMTIQDIAWRWGFRHMGHFSQDYKDLFGELPSQTQNMRKAH